MNELGIGQNYVRETELSLLLEIIEEAKINAENMPTPEEVVSRKKAIEDLQKTLFGQ